MGVDCIIALPDNVRLRTVAKVVGKLLGKASALKPLEDGGQYVEVEGISAGMTSVPEMAEIRVAAAPVFDGLDASLFYHFEGEEPGFRLLLMPRSVPAWIALGRRLADFFGGKVDYQDLGEDSYDHEVPARADAENCPTNDGPWQDLQDRVHALAPLSKAEVRACRNLARYVT